MHFDLDFTVDIVKAAMLLHNFLVDERGDGDADDVNYFRNFSSSTMTEQDTFQNLRRGHEPSMPLFTDCNDMRPVGRPLLDREETDSRAKGEARRIMLMSELRQAGFARRVENYQLNDFGIPYMTY